VLSPSKYHVRVPKPLVENVKFRRSVINQCRTDRLKRRAMMEACRLDGLFWINTFVWTYNPQHEGTEVGPFITWDFQDEAYREILSAVEHRHDLVIEKSREMGASWLCLLVMDWISLFHSHKKFLLLSRSEEAVDKSEEPDCLMWKLDFVHKYLPDWMSNRIGRAKRRMTFKRTESRITGQASTGKAGVGGRATAAFVDEFSQIAEDREMLARTADTTKCRIFNFTHTHVGTAAYDLSQRPDVKKLVMHWSQHPEKNRGLYQVDAQGRIETLDPTYQYPHDYKFVIDGSPTGGPFPGLRSPWYDGECQRRGSSRAVAMDLDINPTGAASQFYEPLKIRELVGKCRDADWRGDLFHSTDSARPIALEPGDNGQLKLWFTPGFTSDGKLCRVPPSTYVVAADLGTGQGATPSCLSVFDVARGMKAASGTYLWTDPKGMAYLAVAMARLFVNADGEPAYLGWETPGPGLIFGNTVLKEIGYRNIYWRTEVFHDEERESDMPGWHAMPASKLHLHSGYRTALSTGAYVNWEKDALLECLSYVHAGGTVEHPRARKNVDPAAEGTNHGDHVVADGLGWILACRRGTPEVKKMEEPPPTTSSILGRRLYNQRIARERASVWS
jgi:hypothetical protein